MAHVRITNIDDHTYAVLSRRAAASGQSLAEYVRLLLEAKASAPADPDLIN